MAGHIAIVGAGPAGMSAAIEAVDRGCRVTLLDEGFRPGGQIFRQASPDLDGPSFAAPAEVERKHRLLAAFDAVTDQIEYWPQTSVYAAFPGPELHISHGGKTRTIRPDAVVLATGVREKVIPFPGWTLPGVMAAGGAQSLLKSQMVLPGNTAVVGGAGPLPLVVAAQLSRAGAKVLALAQLNSLMNLALDPIALWKARPSVLEGLGYLGTVMRSGMGVHTGYVPIKAQGGNALERVTIAKLDNTGRVVAGSELAFNCDLLAVNFGFVANNELAAMFGAPMHYDEVIGGWLPVVDDAGRTSVNGLYVCGDGAALRGAFVAQAEGRIVGAFAAADLTDTAPNVGAGALARAVAQRRQHLAFQKALRRTLQLPGGIWGLADDDTVICRCEHVTYGDIQTAFEQGHFSVNAVKRNTRCGMGWCSGRSCLHSVSALAELHTGKPPEAMMTPRPVIRPVTLDALADHEAG